MNRRLLQLRKLEKQLSEFFAKAFPRKGASNLPALLNFLSSLERYSGLVYFQRHRQSQDSTSESEENLGRWFGQIISEQVDHESEAGYRQWLKEYRRIWRKHLTLFALASSLFIGCILIGWYLATQRPEYVSLLFHQSMQEHILAGEPWFERIRDNVLGAGIEIAINNIQVAAMMFIGGCLLGIGGIVLLIYNGLHIGSILGFCYINQFHEPLINFIVSHGPLELSILVAAAFTGMLVGQVFFQFPYHGFGQRLREAGREAFIVAIGVIPWLLIAAILEVVVSPFDYLSFTSKMMIGLIASLIFWTWTLWPSSSQK